MRDPAAVVEQNGGYSYMYLSDTVSVVIRPDGEVVTVWGAPEFNPNTLKILQDAVGDESAGGDTPVAGE
jgi:hypothetical protein